MTLNGTDNEVGTARFYETSGASVVETVTGNDKPAVGLYEETHTLAPLSVLTLNFSLYADYDGKTATPVCDGAATSLNFTIDFCATAILHMLHLTDAQGIGVFLGNRNFTSCVANNRIATKSSGSNSTSSNTRAGK